MIERDGASSDIRRDRLWQEFIETFDLSAYSAEEIEDLRIWWVLQGMRAQCGRRRRR